MKKTVGFGEWLVDNELDEGILRNLATTAGLGVAGLGLLSTPAKELNPSTSIGIKDTKYQGLLNVLNKKYNLRLTGNDIEVITPEEGISPMYGSEWPSVLQKAAQSQKDDMFSDISTPSMTDIEKIRQKVPVIFADPSRFGRKSRGFCTSEIVDGVSIKFCVIKNRNLASTLRHELTHTTQNPILTGGSSGLRGSEYLLHPDELGVRLAEMKRNYFQLTGIIANSDDTSIKRMLIHFLENKTQYSADVQQLASLMGSDKSSIKKIIEFFKNHIDKVVMNTRSTKYV